MPNICTLEQKISDQFMSVMEFEKQENHEYACDSEGVYVLCTFLIKSLYLFRRRGLRGFSLIGNSN